VSLQVTETGSGRPILLLHGGGGPFTVAGIADHLAESARVIVPTNPGWNGTARPDRIATPADYAALFRDYLRAENLRDVVVIGSSLGGWVAAEVALGDLDGRVAALVLIDSAGIAVPGVDIRDFFALDARGVAEYSYHDPERFYVDPAALPPDRVTAQRANMATMRIVAGDPYMHDPGLRGRLGGVSVPTLVLWGGSDRIFPPAYGAALAAAIPGARFELIEAAGHLPHFEQPEATVALLDAVVAG
jgi:pimeloyl-ACP methyl ester carboxylesterase